MFTSDPTETIHAEAADTHCDAVLTARAVENLARILVPVRGDVNLKRIIHFVGGLVRDSTKQVTLMHVTDDSDEADEKELMIKGMKEELGEVGLDRDLIQINTYVSDNPAQDILDAAQDYDAVVMGETEPSVRDVIFSQVHEKVVTQARGPVMIVRFKE